jgi:predicted metal-dependent peptidase
MRFVILHETMHVALRHLVTWLWMWKADPQLANQACDYVINLLLVLSDADEGFIRMPDDGLLDLKYKDMDAGEVFRLLQEKKDAEKKQGKPGGGGKEPKGFDQHDWKKAKGRGVEATKALDTQIGDALQQGTILAGKMGGDLSRAIGEVLAPKVDWVEQMREFVTALCMGREMSTWRRPSRRSIDSGNYMPSSYSETVGRIGLGVDTSGSISGGVITRFVSEGIALAKLVHPEMIDLLYWDTRVAAHEKYGPGQFEMIATSTKPKGGGGTSPSGVTRYLAENKMRLECLIMLTDGHVGKDWGGPWPCPVLWVIAGNKRAIAGNGKTIHIQGA